MKITPEKSNVLEWMSVLGEASKGERYQALFKKLYRLTAVPSRSRKAVNLYKLNAVTKDGDNVVVPSKVLSMGKLEHKINLTALEYSASALKSLKESGCKVSTIKEMVKESKIKVII